MKDKDRLRLQLEDLFSDISTPRPETVSDEPTPSSDLPAALPPEELSLRSRPTLAIDERPTPSPDLPTVSPLAPTTPTLPQQEDKGPSAPFSYVGTGWRSRLGRRLVLGFLAAAIIPSLIVSIFGFLGQLTRIQNDVRNNLDLVITLQENQVEQWIQSQMAAFASMAREPSLERQTRILFSSTSGQDDFDSARLTINARLRTFLVQHPEFFEIYLLDARGQVILSTDTTHQNDFETGTPQFTRGMETTFYGPPIIVERWDTVGLVVAEPMRYVTGEAQGVLVALFDAAPLTQLTHETPGLGKTGEIYLVNAEGHLVTTPVQHTDLHPGDTIASSGIRKVASGISGRSNYDNYAGKPVLGVYRWLPDLQIGIMAEQEMAEAYNSLITSGGGIVLVAVFSVVLTGFLAGQMARRIANPIVQMTESARQMVAGDLNQSVSVTRTDEIGTLGQAFNHLAQQLRQTITELEKKVQERTHALQQANFQFQKRAIQLEASAQVSRAATSILDPQELLQTTVDLIRDRFGFYHVSIFLLDEAHEWAVVRASTGQVGRQMVTKPHRLAVGGESMVGWVCANRQSRIALDVGADAVHFDNPLLPYTRSEMALPLQVGDRLLGVLNVQSTQEAAFDNDDIRTLQGMADLVAVALENARLFTATSQGVRRQHLLSQITERAQRAARISDIVASSLTDLGQAFDLEKATICLGTESDILSAGNGREQMEGNE